MCYTCELYSKLKPERKHNFGVRCLIFSIAISTDATYTNVYYAVPAIQYNKYYTISLLYTEQYSLPIGLIICIFNNHSNGNY